MAPAGEASEWKMKHTWIFFKKKKKKGTTQKKKKKIKTFAPEREWKNQQGIEVEGQGRCYFLVVFSLVILKE